LLLLPVTAAEDTAQARVQRHLTRHSLIAEQVFETSLRIEVWRTAPAHRRASLRNIAKLAHAVVLANLNLKVWWIVVENCR
jgi:hypothetical protein